MKFTLKTCSVNLMWLTSDCVRWLVCSSRSKLKQLFLTKLSKSIYVLSSQNNSHNQNESLNYFFCLWTSPLRIWALQRKIDFLSWQVKLQPRPCCPKDACVCMCWCSGHASGMSNVQRVTWTCGLWFGGFLKDITCYYRNPSSRLKNN